MGHLNPRGEAALPWGWQAPARVGRGKARHVALVREVARPQFGMHALTGVPSATVWASPDGADAGHRASPTAHTPGASPSRAGLRWRHGVLHLKPCGPATGTPSAPFAHASGFPPRPRRPIAGRRSR